MMLKALSQHQGDKLKTNSSWIITITEEQITLIPMTPTSCRESFRSYNLSWTTLTMNMSDSLRRKIKCSL